ncbi:MAG: M56 family metallopeptidase, partial [Planctomycetota bacterium]|nr:M56 family metallopeptidase [Planctomycetota bacterium]
LITPPLFTIPTYILPDLQPEMSFSTLDDSELMIAGTEEVPFPNHEQHAQFDLLHFAPQIKNAFFVVWGMGSVVLFIISILQLMAFRRSLSIVNTDLQEERWVQEVADSIGLKKCPKVYEVKNNITPIVWWAGGSAKIFLSTTLLTTLSPEQRRHVLAHEFAHIVRKDHLLRWVEWFSCLLMWWNPLAWYARKELRHNEEICCDNEAFKALGIVAKSYAHTLVDVIEVLSFQESTTPRWVSTMAGITPIERRVHMILSDQNPQVLAGRFKQLFLAVALSSLLMGITEAQDASIRNSEDEKGLKAAVEAGEMLGDRKDDKIKTDDEKKQQENQRALRARYSEYEKSIKIAVKAGEMTAEEAEAKLVAARIEMFGKDSSKPKDPNAAALKARYEELQNVLRGKVAAGEMTTEEMEIALSNARNQMRGGEKSEEQTARDRKAEDARQRVIRTRYALLQDKLKIEVAEGRMTEKEASRMLEDALRKMTEESKKKPVAKKPTPVVTEKQRAQRAEYAEIEMRVKTAVKEGKMTRQEAEQTLNDAKARIFRKSKVNEANKDQADKARTEKTQRELRGRYSRLQKKLDGEVAAGRMTREEADKKLAEARKEMFGG